MTHSFCFQLLLCVAVLKFVLSLYFDDSPLSLPLFDASGS